MRYILVPKVDDLGDALAAESTPMRPDVRARRLDTLVRARRSAVERDGRLDALVGRRDAFVVGDPPEPDDALGGRSAQPGFARVAWPPVTVVATPARQTPVTGITVLDAPEDAKDVIGGAFPDHDVVEDFELELIAPPQDALAGGAGPHAADAAQAQPWHLEEIGLLAARRLGFGLTGAGVTVGVLDTGVAEVPELAGRIIENRAFDEHSLDYVPAPIADTDWHGTHVAGIIAGRSVGVAPGCGIVSLTMIPHRIGSFSHYVFALEHAQARPEIQILNMSAGKAGQHPQMRNMAKIAQRLDVLCVMAIGNDGENLNRSPGNYPEVISVGAAGIGGTVWPGSSGGAITWDGMPHATPTLVAPGVDVCSSLPDGSLRAETGTSMAAPVVVGIAALLIEKHPDITVRELRDEILSACVSLDLDAARQGAGIVRLPPSLLAGLPPPGPDLAGRARPAGPA